MTTEPKPLDLPPMPEWTADIYSGTHAANLEAWGRQLAEIAQAQAQRANETEKDLRFFQAQVREFSAQLGRSDTLFRETFSAKLRAEAGRDALKARVAERGDSIYITDGHGTLYGTPEVIGWVTDELDRLESTLAQRDREVLALREALAAMDDAFSEEMERDVIEEIGGASEKSSGWVAVLLAREALASTAQAGEEAERRVLGAARDRLYAQWSKGERTAWVDLEAAILGTESGEGR
jgi:hypothetical protein